MLLNNMVCCEIPENCHVPPRANQIKLWRSCFLVLSRKPICSNDCRHLPPARSPFRYGRSKNLLFSFFFRKGQLIFAQSDQKNKWVTACSYEPCLAVLRHIQKKTRRTQEPDAACTRGECPQIVRSVIKEHAHLVARSSFFSLSGRALPESRSRYESHARHACSAVGRGLSFLRPLFIFDLTNRMELLRRRIFLRVY